MNGLRIWFLIMSSLFFLACSKSGGVAPSIEVLNPVPTVTSVQSSPTNSGTINIIVNFSKDVSGFTLSDVSASNAVTGGFAAVTGSQYTFSIAPIGQGSITVDIPAGVCFATDSALANAAATQFSISYDSVNPTVVISSSASSPTGVNPIPITITFNEAVTGFTAGDLTVGNGTIGSVSGGPLVYTGNITASGVGLVTVDLNASQAVDLAGNGNSAATQFSINYDANTPPTISNITDKSTPQNTPLSFIVFSADEGTNGSLENAQTLSVQSIVSSNQTLVPNANITNSFTDSGNAGAGEIQIMPANGQTGTATITVTIFDGTYTVQDTFVLTVYASISAPTAYPVNGVGAQNVALNFSLYAEDLINPSHSITAWTVVTQPCNGTLSGTAPNLTYTPNPGFSGRDQCMTFTATDSGAETSALAMVTFLINGSAIMVVGDPALMAAGDQQVYDHMTTTLGFSVTLIDDNLVVSTDGDNVDLIMLSSSSGSTNINTKFQTHIKPVMTWEAFLYDDMCMSGSTGTTNTTNIDITNSLHPLSGGLPTGITAVLNSALNIVYGTVNASAEVIATANGSPTLFAYEGGDAVQTAGTHANCTAMATMPAKRIGYFLPDAGAGSLTAAGITLVTAAINEALAR